MLPAPASRRLILARAICVLNLIAILYIVTTVSMRIYPGFLGHTLTPLSPKGTNLLNDLIVTYVFCSISPMSSQYWDLNLPSG